MCVTIEFTCLKDSFGLLILYKHVSRLVLGLSIPPRNHGEQQGKHRTMNPPPNTTLGDTKRAEKT